MWFRCCLCLGQRRGARPRGWMTSHRGVEVELLALCGPTDAQAQAALALLQPLLLPFILFFSCSSSVYVADGAWWERPEGERGASAGPRDLHEHRRATALEPNRHLQGHPTSTTAVLLPASMARRCLVTALLLLHFLQPLSIAAAGAASSSRAWKATTARAAAGGTAAAGDASAQLRIVAEPCNATFGSVSSVILPLPPEAATSRHSRVIKSLRPCPAESMECSGHRSLAYSA